MKKKITIKSFIIAAMLALISSDIKAQSFTENFDNVAGLVGWSITNRSNPIGTTTWTQGNATVFTSFNGATNSFLAANYNCTGATGTISNWMFTPTVTLRNGDVVSFYARSIDEGFPDDLQFRMSTNGASTNVGTTEFSVGDFSTLLLDINPGLTNGTFPNSWVLHTFTISGLSAPTSGRFAFRYFVTGAGSTGVNSDYIGVDNFVYTAYVCPTVTLSPAAISNQTVGVAYSQTLTGAGALGATSYAVTSGALPPGLSLSSAGVISGTPTVTGSYTFDVTVTDASGCTGVKTYAFDIVCGPNSATIPSYSSLCDNGTPFTLTGGLPAGGTYSGTGVSAGVFDPSVGSQFITYTYTDAYSCVNTASTIIVVNTAPTVTAASSVTSAICSGDLVTLTGGGALTYVWDNGATDGVAFAPAVGTTTFNVTGTDGNGCSNTASVGVTVNALPSVGANASATSLCDGDNLTLTGSGAVSYTWDNSVTDGTSFVPAVGTVTYNVTGTDGNGCINTSSVAVTVNALPTVTANASATTLCSGDNLTLTGGGAVSYTWDNSVTDGTAFVPASGTVTYTVIGTDGNGCINSASTTVTVNELPTVSANASATTLCSGDNLTLTGGGAVSYTWDNSVTDGISFVPAVGTVTYNVTGTDGNGCMNTASVAVTVNALPTVTANASSTSLCTGDNLTLTGGGAVSYTWDNSVIDGTSFVPAVGTVTYNVTGTDGNGCVNTASVTVTVNSLPTVSANASGTTLCSGDNLTLTGGGATSYTWDNSVIDGTSFVPAVGTVTYNVTGTDGSGCSNTASVTVIVNALPTVTASASASTLCAGDNLTLTGGGASTYTWDNGVTDATPFTVSTTSATTYNVTGTDGNGCMNTASVSVVINALPTVTASADNNTVCAGTNVTLTGGGAVSYAWDNSVIDATPFTPSVGTVNYTVTGTDGNGCSNTASVSVTVLANSSSNNVYTLCTGGTVTVGTNTYSSNGIYTDVLTSANGCDSTVTTDLTILSSIITSQTITVCSGGSVTVGTNTYTSNGTYTDILTATGGCDSTVTTNLTVLSPITGSQTLTICNGASITVGSNTYNSTGIFTDVLTSFAGCDSTVTTDLTVANAITGSQTLTICNGASITVGSNTYNTTGIFTDVLTSFSGCDSTVTTNLTVANAITGGQTLTICNSASVTVGTNTYNSTGTFTDVLTSYSGCDSTVTTNLTVSPAITTVIDTLLCSNYGETLTVGTSVYSATGTYTDVFTSFSGCDSTVTSNVTATVCSGITEHSFANSLNVYPNPSAGMFTINISNADFKELNIAIYDIEGRMVYSATYKNIAKDYTRSINLSQLSKGMYYLKLNNGSDNKTEKLIIE